MSMLAAPRQKQKVINLRAKNSAWSNDKNKFGQKMLEKMGWSEGKGLGANENGIVEHIVPKYKNDDKGLGYEDRSDQWTKHEDDFNALLANLSNATGNNDLVPSGISLEKKSKKSKARIHYHKYTRGKDLSRYSDKDLANIFGKKSLKNVEVCDNQLPKEEGSQSDQIFTDKGSMDDYFNNKLAELKTKGKPLYQDDSADYAFQGFSENGDYKNTYTKIDPDIKPKKKRKLKCEDQLIQDDNSSVNNCCKGQNISVFPNSDNNTNCVTPGNRKNKKSKEKDQLLLDCCNVTESNIKYATQEVFVEPKNSKKKKTKFCATLVNVNESDPIKKKRKKNKTIEKCENNQNFEQLQKVKRKKRVDKVIE